VKKSIKSRLLVSIAIMSVIFLILNRIQRPNIDLNTFFFISTLSYFAWRTKIQYLNIFFLWLLLIIVYWFSEVYWRVDNNFLYYYHYTLNIDLINVSKERAFIGALGDLIVATALLADLMFNNLYDN